MAAKAIRTFRFGKETLFFLVLSISVTAWVAFLFPSQPDALTRTASDTWSGAVRSFYTHLDKAIAKTLHASTPDTPILRLVVLPVQGSALIRHEFATPSQKDLVDHLRRKHAVTQIEVVADQRVEVAGDLGIEIWIENFIAVDGQDERRFIATLAAHGQSGDLASFPLVATQTISGTNSTLPWFVRTRLTRPLRLGLTLLSLAFILGGLILSFIYYRLVTGTFVGPRWLAIPINELRAATGLIASSLTLLTGLILYVLIWHLLPDTGRALEAQRTHMDVVMAADESVVPSTTLVMSNSLANTMVDVASRSVDMLLDASDTHEANEDVVGDNTFWEWFRKDLPASLRTTATELRISRGATWRLFSATAGQWFALPDFTSTQWLPSDYEHRKDLMVRTLELARDHETYRPFGLPTPWDPTSFPPLNADTLSELQAMPDQETSGQSHMARLLIGSFQYSSGTSFTQWIQRAETKPATERIYSVMLPDRPQSSSRRWQSLEGRLAAARMVSDRVACLFPIPPDLSQSDALTLAPMPETLSIQVDHTGTTFPVGGVVLNRMENAGRPRDLSLLRQRMVPRPEVLTADAKAIGNDFSRWFQGEESYSHHVPIFTIPRSPFFWLVIALGSVFLLAGLRCEENAQGLQAWAPPLLVLFSAVVLPCLLGLWIYLRSDSMRYVIFGYADLAYWGACFLWLCIGVAPFFLGRVRVGLRRGASMTTITVTALAWFAILPLVGVEHRPLLGKVSWLVVFALASATWLASCVVHQPERRHLADMDLTTTRHARIGARGCLHLTCLTFIVIAAGILWYWGWDGQDVPAVFLLSLFLIMVVSGWKRGLYWWRIEPQATYDRIVWLHPINRLGLGLVLTFAGTAVLFCSFPSVAGSDWIKGYISYALCFCIIPFSICSFIVIFVDLIHKEIA